MVRLKPYEKHWVCHIATFLTEGKDCGVPTASQFFLPGAYENLLGPSQKSQHSSREQNLALKTQIFQLPEQIKSPKYKFTGLSQDHHRNSELFYFINLYWHRKLLCRHLYMPSGRFTFFDWD